MQWSYDTRTLFAELGTGIAPRPHQQPRAEESQ
jgi:hypothetical protein